LEIRWMTHSWFQIKAGKATVHVDPSAPDSRFPEGLVRGAEKAGLVLITHHHADHCRKEILDAVSKEGAGVLAPSACADRLGRGMIAMKPGDAYQFGDLAVRAVHSYNTPGGASTVKAHRRGECLGYLLTSGGRTIYHAGDTDLIAEMGSLGPVDAALLPIGGTYTMDVREAAEAVERIKPKVVVPMHYLDANPEDFRNWVGKRAKVVVLKPGEAFSLA